MSLPILFPLLPSLEHGFQRSQRRKFFSVTEEDRKGFIMVTVQSTVDTGHEDMVHDAQMDYYGTRLATCSSDRTIRIFQVQEGKTQAMKDPFGKWHGDHHHSVRCTERSTSKP
ncbi:SEC13 -like protein [Caligus rogercresseyi]|uniref:Protein SEC13 homolog n=1 Tax=Caligus rogercresseyi TaxID=217165 RepID=A0A7T8KAB9_CALRO|nr:SEC13 -like protein [Caligus rogercresseyi]